MAQAGEILGAMALCEIVDSGSEIVQEVKQGQMVDGSTCAMPRVQTLPPDPAEDTLQVSEGREVHMIRFPYRRLSNDIQTRY